MGGMRSRLPLIVTAVVAVLALVGCSGDSGADADKTAAKPKEPISFGDIDQAAWTTDLQATGHVRANPSLELLYDLAKKDCAAKDASDLALGLTLDGAMPDVDRIDIQVNLPVQVSPHRRRAHVDPGRVVLIRGGVCDCTEPAHRGAAGHGRSRRGRPVGLSLSHSTTSGRTPGNQSDSGGLPACRTVSAGLQNRPFEGSRPAASLKDGARS